MSKLIKYNLEFLGETTTASSNFSLESATIVNCLASESIVSVPQSLPIGTVKEIRKLGTDETKIISIQFTNEYVNNSNVSSLSLINYGSFYIIEKITSTFWTVIQSANIFDIAKDDILKNDLTKPSTYGITTNGVTATWDNTKTEVLSIGALRISTPASGTGRYVDFNLYPMEVNRLNSNWNLTLSYLLSTNASGLVTVVLFDGTNELPIVIDNFVYSTSVQNNVGIVFPQTSLIYKLRFKFKDNAECVLHLADIHLGIKDVAVGAAIGNWTSYAPVNNANVSFNSSRFQWRRSGSNMELLFYFRWNTSVAGDGTDKFYIELPTGYSVINEITTNDTYIIQSIGSCAIETKANQARFGVSVMASGGRRRLIFGDDNTIEARPLSDFTIGVYFSAQISVPIAQWTSNINLVEDFQEFAYNFSDTTTTDVTSFGYGPEGASIQAFAPTGTGSIGKRVRFLKPIQATDRIELEVSYQGRWIPFFNNASFIGNFVSNATSTEYYGASLAPISGSATDIGVSFYSRPWAGGATWSQVGTTHRWRVRKISNGNMAESPSKAYINKTTVPELVDLGAGIIESGSNANGSYIKYSDGTMECWFNTTANRVNISENNIGLYGWSAFSSSNSTWTFPAEFSATSDTTCFGGARNRSAGVSIGIPTTTGSVWNEMGLNSQESTNVRLYAKGTWR